MVNNTNPQISKADNSLGSVARCEML